MRFLFWGVEFKPLYVMFQEIWNRRDVEYVYLPISPYIVVKMYDRFRMSRPLIRKYILKCVKEFMIGNDDSAVFVYFNPWGEFLDKSGLLSLLKEKYKHVLHVVLLYDVIVARKLNVERLKCVYDQVYIYDKGEADSYGISFFPPSYSKNFGIPSEDAEIYDVSFVGQSRDRMQEIIKVYKKLTKAGLRCRFYIVGVDYEVRKYAEGITYGKKYLDENEYFHSYIAPAKCLLEIGNAGSNALTARVREAVMYDKKILSNNKALKDYKYYREDMMQIYENVDEIDFGFFDKKKHSYHYEGDFSPVLLLEELKKQWGMRFGLQ